MAQHSQPADRSMTVEQWASLPEDTTGELVDGTLVEEEVGDLTHETIVGWLVAVLRAWLIPRGGFVFPSDAKYRLGPKKGRKPDVTAFFANQSLPRRGAVSVPPDIAVEVVTPTPRDARRDRIDKMEDYALFGVTYYWIVDPEQRLLEIYELGDDGRYVRAVGAADGTVASVPGCEGLRLDLDALWAEIDRLG